MADLLHLSREIAALAQAGIAYSRDPFDKERFARLRQIASELLRASPAQVAQVAQFSQAIHPAPGFEWPAEMGYPTPKIDVRAVVFRDGEVLLVKERSSGLWTPPGGWADVNLTPAENAEKECLEESGYRVKARLVTSIRDRDRAGYPPHPHAVCKIHFLCALLGGTPSPDLLETSEVGFFPLEALPPLCPHRSSVEEIRLANDFHRGLTVETRFN